MGWKLLTNDIIVLLIPVIAGEGVAGVRSADVEECEKWQHGRQDAGQSDERVMSR